MNQFNTELVIQSTVHNIINRYLPETEAEVFINLWDDVYQQKQLKGLPSFFTNITEFVEISPDKMRALQLELYGSLQQAA